MSYSKYNAKPTVVDGHRFHSKKEAKRYADLKLMQRLGEISNLELQPEFAIAINGKHCFKYYADFAYDRAGERVIEDVKSAATAKNDTYRIKKKCVEAAYGISVVEV